MGFPEWAVLHIPHDSTMIPSALRNQFLLSDDELNLELVRMTDHHTLAIFAPLVHAAQVVSSPVSRLVVDVERFAEDEDEPMAARGMGAVYRVTSQNAPLRRSLSKAERGELMQAYYHPHHAQLEQVVERTVKQYGRCLVLDCHSFPDHALPYEMADEASVRPDICIGTDEFHTDEVLSSAFFTAFEDQGWSVNLNNPFAGALVPLSRYRRDRRVSALMIEVNRKLYLRPNTSERLPLFEEVSEKVRAACERAIIKHC